MALPARAMTDESLAQKRLESASIARCHGKSWSSNDRRRSCPLVQEEQQISFALSGGNVPAQVRTLQKWYDKTVLQEACTTAFSAFIIKAKVGLALETPCACAQDLTNESGYRFKNTQLARTPDRAHDDLQLRMTGF